MNPRTVDIAFDETIDAFKIHARDGKPMLEGPAGRVIKSKGWPVYFDGHGGLYAIVLAPREEHAFLESLFREG